MPLLAPLARDLLGVLARARTPRAARPLDRARPACRGACACAFASSGPSEQATLHDRLERLLDHVALGGEAAQRHVVGKALERRPRRQPHQLGLGHRGLLAHARDDLGAAAPPGGRGRSWTPARGRGRRGTGRARARPAGRRPTRAATRRSPLASSTSSVTRSTLNATSGGRAVTSTAPAVGCGARGPVVGHELAAGHPLGQPAGPAARRIGRARRARGAWPAGRRGTPAARARRRSARRR